MVLVRVNAIKDADGKWKQLSQIGFEMVEFSNFSNFDQNSGQFRDTLIWINHPLLQENLYPVSFAIDKIANFPFKAVCQKKAQNPKMLKIFSLNTWFLTYFDDNSENYDIENVKKAYINHLEATYPNQLFQLLLQSANNEFLIPLLNPSKAKETRIEALCQHLNKVRLVMQQNFGQYRKPSLPYPQRAVEEGYGSEKYGSEGFQN